jgi:hypothetical protein
MIDTKGLIPIAIGCTPGSGSRVLHDILNAAAQIRMDPDVGPVTKDSVGSQRFVHARGNSREALRRLIEELMAEIIDGIPSEQLHKFRYFGWKNPYNIRVIDLFFEISPAFRFIHLLRDPAALARGKRQKMLYRDGLGSGTITPGTNRKRVSLQRWEVENLPVWQRYHDQPNYLVVHYEDIVLRPEETVRSVFAWLRIEEFDLRAALSSIAPPPDPISRGNGVDVSIIADACELLGYGHRVRSQQADAAH